MRIPASERFIGVIGYLPILCLFVARFVRRDSLFVQFHSRQASVLFVMWAVLALICFVVIGVTGGEGLATDIPFYIIAAASILYVLMMLVGVLKVLLGERYRMPLVADVALVLKL